MRHRTFVEEVPEYQGAWRAKCRDCTWYSPVYEMVETASMSGHLHEFKPE